jgi:hypothetical protein
MRLRSCLFLAILVVPVGPMADAKPLAADVPAPEK